MTMKTNYTAPEIKVSEFEYENILTTSAVKQAETYLNSQYNDSEKPLERIITLSK